MKQGGRQGGGAANTKSVLGSLDFLWQHPNPCRRLGANSLLRVLREKELVSVYLLQLLVAAVTSLGVGQDQAALTEAAGSILAHLQKMLLHYRGLFLRVAESRRVPGELGGGSLAHLQEWLLSLAAASHTATRHRVFFLLRHSSPLDCDAVLARREGGLPAFLSKVLSQPGLQEEPSLQADVRAVAWYRGLQAVLESLGLLVGEALLTDGGVVALGGQLARLLASTWRSQSWARWRVPGGEGQARRRTASLPLQGGRMSSPTPPPALVKASNVRRRQPLTHL